MKYYIYTNPYIGQPYIIGISKRKITWEYQCNETGAMCYVSNSDKRSLALDRHLLKNWFIKVGEL